MNAKQILQGLEDFHEGIPSQLLLEAVKKKTEITDELIAAVEEVGSNPQAFLDDPERNLYYWASYLLAHFEEARALPAFLKMFRLSDQYDELVLDIIAEDGAMILANVVGDNVQEICALLHDRNIPSAAREAAADGLGLLCAWGAIEPERVLEEYRRALDNLRENDFLLASTLVDAAVELNLRALSPEITAAFDRKLVDPDDFEFTAEWLHDPDFPPPPPYIHLVQKIDDIVEFFEEKAMIDGLEDADLT